MQFHGALLLGDNFYPRLRGPRDRYWRVLFEEMYDPRRLNMPFYAALGNHDYQGNKAQIQLDYARENPDSRWKMPALWYRLDIPAEKPLVTVLMLNSNKRSLSRDQWQRQLRWLEEELSRPRTAPWLIACAHHPFFSNGLHGDNPSLQADWGPLFTRSGVDFYLAGHDHSLQHLEIGGWRASFLVSGGGGRVLYPHIRARGPFARSVNGFVHLQFVEDRALVRVIHGHDGRLLHAFERNREGGVIVRATTGIDRVIRLLKPIESDPFEELPPEMPIPATLPATIPATRPADRRGT